METVHVHRPGALPRWLVAAMRDGQREAGRLWTDIVRLHVESRRNGRKWPGEKDLRQTAKGGRYALHSQTIQAVIAQLVANVDATRTRRASEPRSRAWLRFPWKDKRHFPLYWPAQAVSYDRERRRLVLPMGRGRRSLVFRLDLDFEPGAAKLAWNDGFEIHLVRSGVEQAQEAPGPNRATVDLGEIHQAAVVTDTGKALVVPGRGIRSHKRLLSKQLGEIARKRSRCTKGSRQSRRLQAARQKRSLLTARRVKDLRHKGTRKVIAFCRAEGVGALFVGDPRGVRQKDSGRKQNQRMARWEMGGDISYLGHKAERARIQCSTGDERGTSSRCPACGNRQKVKGRVWRCRACPFVGPRDVVGGMNMHPLAFGTSVTLPAQVTYLRPGPERAGRGVNNPAPARATGRSSRPDTALREARSPSAPQLLGNPPPPGTTSGHPQAPAAAARSASGCRETQPRAA
jgi:putative transposase